jgi:hypothetical protein
MRAGALAIVSLLVTASCATTPATTTPTPPRLVWLHSGHAVSGVTVTALAGSRIRVVDRGSALVLFEGDAPAGATLRIAEPVRIRGTIPGSARHLRVRIGSGPREPVILRAYRAIGRPAPEKEKTALVHGLALPLSPSRWDEAATSGERFEGWIRADADAQIVAFDGDGRVLVHDLPMPRELAPRETIDAGPLELEPTAGVDIDVALPPSDVPIAMLVGVRDAVIEPGLREAAARILSVLDQIDERLFGLLVVGRGLTLSYAGSARLRAMPPFASIDFLVHEPDGPGVAVRRAVLQPGSVTPLRLALGDVASDPPRRTQAFHGRVVRGARKTPVVGATVVVSDHAARREATTDIGGRFTVDGIRTDRRLTVFVDHAMLGSHAFRGVDAAQGEAELEMPVTPRILDDLVPRPQISQSTPEPCTSGTPAIDPTPPPANSDELVLIVPLDPPTPTPPPFPLNCAGDDPTGNYGTTTSWVGINASDQYDPESWTGIWLDPAEPGGTASMYVCSPGLWTWYYAPTPFAVMGASFNYCSGSSCPGSCEAPSAFLNCPASCDTCFVGEVTFEVLDPQNLVPTVTLTFTLNGQPLVGQAILFSPYAPFEDYESAEYDTDASGTVTLCQVDPDGLHLYTYAPASPQLAAPIEIDCDVTVSNGAGSSCTIELTAQTPGNPCTCQALQ